MLGNLSIPQYSERSDNLMGADHQQERPDERLCHYLVGFVDGEGSFHVAIQRRKDLPWGWQLIPEFHVPQHREKPFLLEKIKEVLGCGYIKPNHPGSSHDVTNVFVVRNRRDLLEKVVPFFERYLLLSEKREDFDKFVQILKLMDRGAHLTKDGLGELVKLAFSMYGDGRSRKLHLNEILSSLESSETIRRTLKAKI